MAPYSPPTLGGLRDAVARDLRDTTFKTWTPTQVDDLINAGISELNRIRPLEQVEQVEVLDGVSTYVVGLSDVFALDRYVAIDAVGRWDPVPGASGLTGTQDGWAFYGNTLTLPPYMVLPPDSLLRVIGYGNRDPLVGDNDVAEFIDYDDELAVRSYARYFGAEALMHNRLLYQQWQGQVNNTDISPTQLLQTVGQFQTAWETTRNRIRRLRRVA